MIGRFSLHVIVHTPDPRWEKLHERGLSLMSRLRSIITHETLEIFYQQTRQTRMKIYGIPLLFMQETKWKSYEMIDVNDYSLMRLIYLLLLGLPEKKRFPTETEIWLISSLLYHKCAYTALELRETMLKLLYLTLYRPNVKMATLVSYSFVYIQISLSSLVLKCKIPKNYLSQAMLVRLILI